MERSGNQQDLGPLVLCAHGFTHKRSKDKAQTPSKTKPKHPGMLLGGDVGGVILGIIFEMDMQVLGVSCLDTSWATQPTLPPPSPFL